MWCANTIDDLRVIEPVYEYADSSIYLPSISSDYYTRFKIFLKINLSITSIGTHNVYYILQSHNKCHCLSKLLSYMTLKGICVRSYNLCKAVMMVLKVGLRSYIFQIPVPKEEQSGMVPQYYA